MASADLEEELERAKDVVLQHYGLVIRVHTILAAHTVCYPCIDYEHFDKFLTFVWPTYDYSTDIFRQADNERPLDRAHFLKALLLIAQH